MKRSFILFMIAVLFGGLVSAQDLIIKVDGEEIQTKIIEVTSNEIRYRLYDQPEGPVRSISKSEVFLVIYEDGRRESFSTEVTEEQLVEEVEDVEDVEDVEEVRTPSTPGGYKGNFVAIGVGYGVSYGGLGTRFQWRVGGNVGFGLNAGLGLNVVDAVGLQLSGGVKFYVFQGIYINTQFGIFQRSYYDYYYGYDEYYIDVGPSVLVGVDWTWGRKVGFGFNAALGFTRLIDDEEMLLASDVGFVIRF